jgi:predicted RNase H-like HicB family nuclease
MNRHVAVRCAWDDEADVWYVQESDVPGLVTEADTLEALRRKLPGMIQDLLEVETAMDIEVDLIAYAHDRVRVQAA